MWKFHFFVFRLPQKEIIRIVLHHTVGITGEVTKSGDIEPGAGGNLQHAAPRLVAEELYLCRVEELRVVLPWQVVVHAVQVFVKRQNLSENDDLRQLGSALLRLWSPVVG